MKSILLDFCNMDIRKVSGLFNNYSCFAHKNILGHWLNLSAFLTVDTCFLPIGFAAECSILQSALESKRPFFDASIFRIASRELNTHEFLSKRRTEYNYKRAEYADLFSEETDAFIARYAQYLISRRGKTGIGIANKWRDRDDKAPIWSKIIGSTLSRTIDRVRNRPTVLISRGNAVLWSDIVSQKGVSVESSSDIRDLLNRDLLTGYLQEYDVSVLKNLPFGWRDILDTDKVGYLNIDNFRSIVGETIFSVICTLPPEQIIELRDDFDTFSFVENYAMLADQPSTDRGFFRRFGLQARAGMCRFDGSLGKVNGTFLSPASPQAGLTAKNIILLKRALSHIGECIERSGQKGSQMTGQIALAEDITSPLVVNRKRSIALFAALDMETRIISKGLEMSARSDNSWIKQTPNLDIYLYSSMGMGRVRAAVATMLFLRELTPDLIVIVGIAGGFSKSGGEQGQIIVPENVIDLSIRKIYEKEGTEFRPEPYNLSNVFRDKLMSPKFDKNSWFAKAVEDLDWPSGKRPSFIFDRDITSVDEVVSATGHIDAILEAYPRLIAVEMEAGGVCAACRKLRIPVCVIRGISDKADPAKKDDEWRSLAMKTIVHLLNNFDLNSIF